MNNKWTDPQDGLPPVGTVCEVEHNEWRRCEVFAHKVNSQGTIDALFSYERADGTKDWNWCSKASKFRPIRTHEQIAAEEREKAISEMFNIYVDSDTQRK